MTRAAINSGDTAWMLASSALVMIMTPAVGFFYGGMVSSKNVVSVIKQSMIILALVSVQWVVIGYSLAFGPDVHGFIGNLANFGLRGVGYAPDPNYAATIPALVYMIFQAMFAIVTPALIIGAFVERIKFKTLVIFTLLWTTLVYDPVAHWVWSPNGWLHALGALDFAGGTVVHMTAGFSALAAALLVGKRLETRHIGNTANNVPFVILGAALLWFGWFGFNAGSALSAGALAASAFVVTNTAAAAAALTWVALSWAENKKPSAMAAAIGAVCGLVAITPASGFVGPVASIAIGILGGAVTYLAVYIRGRAITNRRHARRVGWPRHRRAHRRVAHRRVCRKSDKRGGQQWPFVRQPTPALGAIGGSRCRGSVLLLGDVGDTQSTRDGALSDARVLKRRRTRSRPGRPRRSRLPVRVTEKEAAAFLRGGSDYAERVILSPCSPCRFQLLLRSHCWRRVPLLEYTILYGRARAGFMDSRAGKNPH